MQDEIEELRLTMRRIRDVAHLTGNVIVADLATVALLPTLVP